MNRFVWFLWLPFLTFAQNKVEFEHNSYVYNALNCGYDITNNTQCFLDDSGKLWTKGYAENIYKIGNTEAIIPFDFPNQSETYIESYFIWNGKKCLGTNEGFIYDIDGEKTRKILTNSNEQLGGHFVFQKNIYYFSSIRNYDHFVNSVKTYQKGEIKTLKTFNFDFDIQQYSSFVYNNEFYFSIVYKSIFSVYKLNKHQIELVENFQLPKDFPDHVRIIYKSITPHTFLIISNKTRKIYLYTDKKIKSSYYIPDLFLYTPLSIYKRKQNYLDLMDVDKEFYIKTLYHLRFSNDPNQSVYDPSSNSYYMANGGPLTRIFPHIKKYPTLFNQSNSNAVFTMAQSQDQALWFGSYNSSMMRLKNNILEKVPFADIKFMNSFLKVGEKMVFFGEAHRGNFLVDAQLRTKNILKEGINFFGYAASDGNYYLGSAGKGLVKVNTTYFKTFQEKDIIHYQQKEGIPDINILTISEDQSNNIWFAGSKGIGVFNPKSLKTIYYDNQSALIDKSGSIAMVKDFSHTLWIGKTNGALGYFDGNQASDPKNIKYIEHPLFHTLKKITFLHTWHDQLIIGAENKILVFDLGKWYQSQKIAVRYLNPIEINLTSRTEQNTILTDQRDQSVWFATNDMVYQWDINKWLSLPTYKVTPNLLINDSINYKANTTKRISFGARENSFNIKITYETPDNMPRFINVTLTKANEKPRFNAPNLNTIYQYANVSSGDYIFYIQVCQQDGSYDVFSYPITIKKFFWQSIWFWLIASLLPIGTIAIYYRKQKQIEQQKQKLTQYNLTSLSNQFRPHFMLNALNSIGSQMEGKPHAEKVISRLGESINIIYNFTQKNDFAITFADEWKMVENSIEIQKLLFIPELKTEIKSLEIIPSNFKLPVGLFQIPVENALLHGLRNKKGDCLLKIDFSENVDHFFITIFDNGVGREKAAQMNYFKKNGKGLKTVFDMLYIINKNENDSIIFTIEDPKDMLGTIVNITIKKHLDYDKIRF